MGPIPRYLKSHIVSACQVLGLYLHSFFRQKYHFCLFLNTERGGAIYFYLFKPHELFAVLDFYSFDTTRNSVASKMKECIATRHTQIKSYL